MENFLTAKVSTFIYRNLQGNPDQERFTIWSGVLTGNDARWRSASSGSPLPKWTEVAYWPAMMLGGAAQVVAAHCPNEQTLDPAACSYNRPTYAPASHT